MSGKGGHEPPPKAGAGGPSGAAEEFERLKREVQQAKDQYLRTLAEADNATKRLHREKEEFLRYAAESVVRALLPIVDSLDQALLAVDPSARPANAGLARDSAPRAAGEGEPCTPVGLRKQSDIEAIIKGVHLIYRQLLGLLDKEGVKRIPTVGEPFDPHRHEAVAQVEAGDGVADDTVAEEVQVGYTMHGKVIRPAIVKVAKRNDRKIEDEERRTAREDKGAHHG